MYETLHNINIYIDSNANAVPNTSVGGIHGYFDMVILPTD